MDERDFRTEILVIQMPHEVNLLAELQVPFSSPVAVTQE